MPALELKSIRVVMAPGSGVPDASFLAPLKRGLRRGREKLRVEVVWSDDSITSLRADLPEDLESQVRLANMHLDKVSVGAAMDHLVAYTFQDKPAQIADLEQREPFARQLVSFYVRLLDGKELPSS